MLGVTGREESDSWLRLKGKRRMTSGHTSHPYILSVKSAAWHLCPSIYALSHGPQGIPKGVIGIYLGLPPPGGDLSKSIILKVKQITPLAEGKFRHISISFMNYFCNYNFLNFILKLYTSRTR